MGFGGFAASLAAKGLPLPTLWAIAAVAAEFGGSLCILFGLATRLIAPVMVVFVAFAAFLGHPFWATDAEHYQAQHTNFMKDITIAGGFLALFVSRPGAISLDGWLRRRAETPLHLHQLDAAVLGLPLRCRCWRAGPRGRYRPPSSARPECRRI